MAMLRGCVGITLRSLGHSSKRLLGEELTIRPSVSYSIDSEKSEELQVASVVKQEGSELKELPILVRVFNRNVQSQSQSCSYSTDNTITVLSQITEEDELVKYQLQNCKSVHDVVKKLEIPAEGFSALSAVITLHRIWQLKERSSDGIDFESHIQTAFLNQLYKIINNSMSGFNNEMLISLVHLYCKSESFQEASTNTICNEIEKRLWDVKFSIAELCSLSNVLDNYDTPLNRIIQLVWVQMCSRDGDINEKNLSMVFSSVPKMKMTENESVWDIVQNQLLLKKFKKNWWELSGTDMTIIVAALQKHSVKSWTFFDIISKWLYANINQIELEDLEKFLYGFMSLHNASDLFIGALEKYVLSHIHDLDLNVLALIMQYLVEKSHLSNTILSTAAKNYKKNGHLCTPQQTFLILRPFGIFDYKEEKLDEMFLVAEDVIQRDFDKFNTADIVELLCSFIYLDRIPLNFATKVLSAYFWNRSKATLSKEELNNVAIGLNLIKYCTRQKNLQTWRTAKSEIYGLYLQERKTNHPFIFVDFMYTVVGELDSGSLVLNLKYAFPNQTFLNYGGVIMIDRNGQVVNTTAITDSWLQWSSTENPDGDDKLLPFIGFYDDQKKLRHNCQWLMNSPSVKKIVLLMYTSDCFCKNTGSLLGKYRFQKKFLENKGCTVIEVQYGSRHEIRKMLINHKVPVRKTSLKFEQNRLYNKWKLSPNSKPFYAHNV